MDDRLTLRQRPAGGNLTPVGRILYSTSTVFCVPASKDQEVGLTLGAQIGPSVHSSDFFSWTAALLLDILFDEAPKINGE